MLQPIGIGKKNTYKEKKGGKRSQNQDDTLCAHDFCVFLTQQTFPYKTSHNTQEAQLKFKKMHDFSKPMVICNTRFFHPSIPRGS